MSATPALETGQIHSLTRPNMVSVGTIIWLSSELMFFSALFAMYFSSRAAQPGLWAEHTPDLPFFYSLPFTIVLVLSSVTCQFGVFSAERGDVYGLRRWFVLTFIMGLIFVIGQAGEFYMDVQDGVKLNGDSYGSVFYLTTGFHGLHVIGGLVAFIFLLTRTTMGRFTAAQATSAIVVSYYWHFVDVVWIALFSTIFLIK